jgi:hypothetical protein
VGLGQLLVDGVAILDDMTGYLKNKTKMFKRFIIIPAKFIRALQLHGTFDFLLFTALFIIHHLVKLGAHATGIVKKIT